MLGPAGIVVVPLKGVLLHATVYRSRPQDRPLADVDVLVAKSRVRDAQRLLVLDGWRLLASDPNASMLVKADRPLPLDLHARLYGAERYGPDPGDLIARALPDPEAFGVDVRLPLPEDLYAHLVGHFVKDRRDERQMHSLIDLREVAKHHRLDPASIARHLDANGLGRAARYALPLARDHAADTFAGAVLEHLRPDPLGEGLSRFAVAVVKRSRQPSKLAALPVALLNRSLLDAGWALGTRVAHTIRRETRRLARRAKRNRRSR